MKKLSKYEIKKILNSINLPFDELENLNAIEVYHIHDWDHGYDGYTGFCGTRREFYNDFFQMQNFLREYVKEKNIRNVIISPLNQGYYFNGLSDSVDDIYDEINNFLFANGIDKRYESGLEFDVLSNLDFIDAICEGAYRDISNIGLIFHECGTILVPHHHMNFFTYSDNLENELSFLKKILMNTNDIDLFYKI